MVPDGNIFMIEFNPHLFYPQVPLSGFRKEGLCFSLYVTAAYQLRWKFSTEPTGENRLKWRAILSRPVLRILVVIVPAAAATANAQCCS
jgi:hypothetical protein